MNTSILKGRKYLPGLMLSMLMFMAVGFSGNAQAWGSCNTCSMQMLDVGGLLRPVDFGLFGNGCCHKRVVRNTCCHHRHVSHNAWTNWQPFYKYSKCGCPVHCKKSCLVSRCSGKVIRCVKKCSY